MKRLLMLTLLAASAAAYAGPGAHGPNGEHLDAPAQTLVVADRLARLPDGSVSMPMLAQRRLGIRTVLARQSAVAATVELPGRVLMDPNAGGRVQTVVGGKVQPGPAGLPLRHCAASYASLTSISSMARSRARCSAPVCTSFIRVASGLSGTCWHQRRACIRA